MALLCNQCPRACSIDRSHGACGVCRVPDTFVVSRVAPHMWEEPPISGTNGSGTVFFSGCNLHCVFCQNREISRDAAGEIMSDEALAEAILALADSGVHNINLVTPTHYSERLFRLLCRIKHRLKIPVVWNSSGYESPDTLRMLDGLVDIYLPDLKYCSPELAARYSGAPDYFFVAMEALDEMLRQRPEVKWNEEHSLLSSGVVVRHLVLPGSRKDSIALLHALAKRHEPNRYLLSLMGQYTPDFALDVPCPVLHRRVTSFEYDSVLDTAKALGFDGFSQDLGAATKEFTPRFSEK